MRSRNCTMQGPDDGHIQPTKGFIKQHEENPAALAAGKKRVPREETDTRAEPAARQKTASDLSKKELLRLLGVMEGEVQAREDVINLLKSEGLRPEALEAHYGSSVPVKPLQALQRDRLLTHSSGGTDDVYEKPMAELQRLEDKQRETYRRMLEQLLLAEKCHRRTVVELDNEKRKHADFMNKSDDFTSLLEQERERLKRLLEQEKAYQARKDKDHNRRLEKVRAELVKLKSFALMLVDERQLHIEQIDQQSQKIQDLTQTLLDKEQRLAAAISAAKEDAQKVLRLEVELENKETKFGQEHEEMTAKLVDQESQSRQLRLKLAALARRMEELEESNQVLQKSEEDLQELREKISKGECGSSSLMSELENLRKRVLEMEGKDEEITKTETQCRELRKKLQDEENHSKELRLEVDKLQKRMAELEKLEGAFNKSKAECSHLHTNLEKEKGVVKGLAGELEKIKTRLKDLESSESKLERAEMVLKDDLMKLKSFTVILVDERKNLTDRLKQEEQKSDDLSKMCKAEQGKVTAVTEKLIEESKKLLKFKSETEIKVTTLIKENEQLKAKLASEEEKSRELFEKLSVTESKWVNRDNKTNLEQDNKVKELTVEIERLKSRLQQLEVVEGDLMKTEDEYDLLEKKFRTEQDKANALSEVLEQMKAQIARNKAIEKGEVRSPEAELRTRCKMEEAKSRELQADVQALKEKIHELMNKEDVLSQLQVDYSVLKQRFVEEEEKRTSMSQEVDDLTKELEASRRYSRALRPGLNGRRMVDAPLTSTAVQTEPAEDQTAAGFIRKSVLEENHLMSNLRQRDLRKPTVLERYPPASSDPGARKSWIPWMKKKEKTVDVSMVHPPEMSLSPKPGQPLHIRVTPDPDNSTATLEISSPRAEEFFSSTTIIPTLGLQKPRITILPKPTTVSSKTKVCDLDRAKSPVTITTISRSRSPEDSSASGCGSLQSPVSIITVSTTPVSEVCASAEPHEAAAGRTVIKVSPDKQPLRKYSANSNIITTGDNKIHIHLGPQFQRPTEGCGGAALGLRPLGSSSESRETGTVLRCPRQPAAAKAAPNKMTSSITITPLTSNTSASRPTQAASGSDAQSARAAATRIPVSKGVKASSKAVLGVSTVARFESRAESQSMKIELRKSTVCSASAPGAKS
ncbi:filamin-A-interacting protein 1-like [Betta splendens]|uniref:Filamin-A-interacting protein 1-like n=1 Tax=Betta splendens TaxID=158456 RepID=A0A6P7LTT3_BETSP|nr:filamin-A-interacting protein 1-like [Betta splendens]